MFEWTTPQVEKLLDEVKEHFNQIKAENNRLRAENNKLKNEHYKDEELAALEAENRKLQSYLTSGCYITPEELNAIKQWENGQGHPVCLRILFEPTPIGVVGTAQDLRTKATFIFRDI
jgi:regulator of replication initiation timing